MMTSSVPRRRPMRSSQPPCPVRNPATMAGRPPEKGIEYRETRARASASRSAISTHRQRHYSAEAGNGKGINCHRRLPINTLQQPA